MVRKTGEIEKIMSRNSMLAAIRANQPESLAHPGEYAGPAFEAREKLFAERLAFGGGQAIFHEREKPLAGEILPFYPANAKVLSFCEEVNSTVAVPAEDAGYAELDVAILRGVVAVAENGAVWVPFFDANARRASLLANDVVLLVARENLVGTMHEAMQHEAFLTSCRDQGAFLSGPSKTADIEQCLVIGAHGPCAMRVFLI